MMMMLIIYISGGDGLSNNLLSVERIVTPDTDVKAILKITNGEDWREKYVFVELHIERAVDYMVHCLNGNPRYEIEYCEGIQNEEWWLEPDKIRELFYEEKLKGVFEFKICNNDNFINPEKKNGKRKRGGSRIAEEFNNVFRELLSYESYESDDINKKLFGPLFLRRSNVISQV